MLRCAVGAHDAAAARGCGLSLASRCRNNFYEQFVPRPTRTDVNHEFAANSSFLYDLIATWITSHNSAHKKMLRAWEQSALANGFSFKLHVCKPLLYAWRCQLSSHYSVMSRNLCITSCRPHRTFFNHARRK